MEEMDWSGRDRKVRAVIEKHGWTMSVYHAGDYEFSIWKGKPSFFKRLTTRRPASVNLRKGLIRVTVWNSAYTDEVKAIARELPGSVRVDT